MRRSAFALAVSLALASAVAQAETLQSDAGPIRVTEVVAGLDEPWGFGFLPDGGILITERDGRLLLVRDGTATEVTGVPRVAARGQGGLLDLLVPRNFAADRTLFFTFAEPAGMGRAGTSVLRARLSDDGQRLEGAQTIFSSADPGRGGRHFGSRIVEAPDGMLFVTIGDRGARPSAQDVSNHNGSVLRIARDGTPAPGNPGLAQPEIWSYGHRNPQGAALDLDGNLWTVEHGAQGGDEINRITPGANYGWPVISYGEHYGGGTIGEGTAKDGMKQPAFYWDPSMAPSGMMVYSGALWPEWRGDIFVGSLKFGYVARVSGAPLAEAEQLEGDATARVRDVREGPQGGIWFLSVGNGALYRMTPG